MASNSSQSNGGGCLGWFIAVAIVIAIVVYSVSGLGHLLGLTPTGDEVLNQDGEWLDRHYEGVVVGYVLTVLLILLPVAAFFLLSWARENQTAEEQTALKKGLAGTAVLLLTLIVVLPVGALETPTSGGPEPGNQLASGGPGTDQEALERRRERRAEIRDRRERRLEQRQERRALQRARERQREKRAEQEASDPECDPNYTGCLDPNAVDYDCAGGEGDGPEYTGPITVIGTDHYELDTGDGDPAACELE